jgi:hypothetical protein
MDIACFFLYRINFLRILLVSSLPLEVYPVREETSNILRKFIL